MFHHPNSSLDSFAWLLHQAWGYRSRNSSTKPTIIEALRATCAIPELFSPVSIKVTGCRVLYVTGSRSFNNPAAETIKEATEHFGRSCPVACMISLGCGQRIIRAVDGGSGTNPVDLIEAVASDLGPSSQPAMDSSQDPAEAIVMHSKVHLGQAATMEKVDQCVAVAERLGRSTLGDIGTFTAVSIIPTLSFRSGCEEAEVRRCSRFAIPIRLLCGETGADQANV
jgi:predicted acylesterase/phospholipase RssA